MYLVVKPYQSESSGQVEYIKAMREQCLGNSAKCPRKLATRGVIEINYSIESGDRTVYQKPNF